ncbi:BREX-6 system phosphatase PglZ [Polyangium sorediatum]|uniref:BREX-6 system phosphatase PglZ n=1 Tax=Polyangium sorediatum TaxID=889274 RepID=A0ABT6P2U4_9BACT|nr:BREX-6 system phosphatase PglZ [Polyangium sorediatum]MDI1434931.1 BREX-6 system phosphatase PglZ [Polyangium sorediatum]
MRELGPISESLFREVAREVRRQGIVVWLDRDNHYTAFVDALIQRGKVEAPPFPIVAFRGSFLELLLALQDFGNGLSREPLLVHMPGFNEDLIKQTPVLELYDAGVRFRKALDTLIRETAHARVAPADVEAFLAKPHTLDEADAWLDALVSQRAGGFAAMLDNVGQTLLVQALAGREAALHAKVNSPDEIGVLRGYLHKLTGMDEAWIGEWRADAKTSPLDHVLDAFGAWLLCVEYVHDLRRLPHVEKLRRLRDLPPPIVKTCVEMLAVLRSQQGDAYARRADEVEGSIAAEIAAMTPDDLGQIDTFPSEERRVLAGAVEALQRGEWEKARVWCDARHGERSFWLQRNQDRRWEWSLVAEAAAFGETLAKFRRPLEGVQNLDQAVDRYATGAFEVDRAHRRFEQKRLTLLEPRLPHFGPLQEVVGVLRRLYRAWADELCRDFTLLCKEQGFLPPPSLQQRMLFEQVVVPLTHGGEKVAMFVIDAFRFEMATELLEELGGGGGIVDLKPRLAELPTITSVGMNALAPVAQNGRLVVAGAFQGFKTGEYTVKRPTDRARAMGTRAAGKEAPLLSLAQVCEETTTALAKKVAPHGLVVVHSKEIDDAGEANVGLPTFETTLRQIKAAWHHLQLAGVKHFVFTADHGFLLQDETTQEKPYGDKEERSRRHVLSEYARSESGMVPVALSSLGYDGLGGYVILRQDTAVFATGNPGATFVHGGNSLEERVIPVLTVTKKRAESASLAEYMLETEALPGVLGLHRLRVRAGFAKNTSTGLGFATARVLDIGLRVQGRPEIQTVLKDVSAPALLHNGRVKLPLGDTWTEVFFALHGPKDERVRVEVHHPDNIERVQSSVPENWFSVSGGTTPAAKAPETAVAASESGGSWADAIADEGFRKVFQHIQKHGVITEPEVGAILGSARAFRKFSVEIDLHLGKLPFRVRIEAAEGGKRYVREGDK